MELIDRMDMFSSDTWGWVSRARAPEYVARLGEVTVTELSYAVLQPYFGASVEYVVPDEPTTGADWQWWFYDSFKQRSWSIWAQAKILSTKGNLSAIRYSVGGVRQAQTLHDVATAAGGVPVHVFYLGSMPAACGVPQRCALRNCTRPGHLDVSAHGCVVVPTARVLELMPHHGRATRLDSYTDEMLPWAHLFDGLKPYLAGSADTPLPGWLPGAKSREGREDLPVYVREVARTRREPRSEAEPRPSIEVHRDHRRSDIDSSFLEMWEGRGRRPPRETNVSVIDIRELRAEGRV